MKPERTGSRFLFAVFCLLLFGYTEGRPQSAASGIRSGSSGSFLENAGQLSDGNGNPVPSCFAYATLPGLDIFLTSSGLTFVMHEAKEEEKKEPAQPDQPVQHENEKVRMFRYDMELCGAHLSREQLRFSEPAGETVYHFYTAAHPEGLKNRKRYRKITVQHVYPGVDWELEFSADGFKQSFRLAPFADPALIRMQYNGLKKLHLDQQGNLVLQSKLGTVTEQAPVSYQNGRSVPTRFNREKNTISYITGKYDTTRELLIDPLLTWGTLYAGNHNDGFRNIFTDNSGNLFVCGYTQSTVFPVFNAGTYYSASMSGLLEGILLKFDASHQLLWATYAGGSGIDNLADLVTDNAGNLFVCGNTDSPNFPTLNAGTFYSGTSGGMGDGVLLKFDNAGNMLWSTYVGGSGNDLLQSVAITPANGIVLNGYAMSSNFPLLNPGGGAYFSTGVSVPAFADAVILSFSNNGTLLWSTYFGGNEIDFGYGITTDAAGKIFLTGTTRSSNLPVLNAGTYFDNSYNSVFPLFDLYIAAFSPTFVQQWGTYWGGTGNEWGFTGIATDGSGNVYVAGTTESANMPVLNGGGYFDGTLGGTSDGVISRFDNSGNLIWSTFVGGSLDEPTGFMTNIAVTNCDAVVTGFEIVRSADFPVIDPGCGSYSDNTFGGGVNDAAVVMMNPAGDMLWSSFLGSSNSDFRCAVAADKTSDGFYLCGEFSSYNAATALTLPLINPGGSAYYNQLPGGMEDSYILRFDPVPLTVTASFTQPACTCNGSINITPSCGTPPYTYNWNTGDTTAILSNCCSGNYQVVVSDQLCQKDTLFFTLTDSSSISITLTPVNGSCSSPATILSAVSGGAGSYVYAWSNGQTTPDATGLAGGLYTLTVTDSNGCSATASASVINSGSLTLNTVAINGVCPAGGNTGSALVQTGSGNAPFTYLWSNGQTDSLATGLAAGTYTIQVTDSSGCTGIDTILVPLLAPPVLSTGMLSAVSCAGGNDGQAAVTVSGGTSPYTYLWSNGTLTSVASALGAGTYSVVVTDAAGCSDSLTVSITAPAPLQLSVSATAMLLCAGNSDTLTATIAGGTPGYNINWLPGGANTPVVFVTPMTGTTYTLQVTDTLGCTADTSITIQVQQPPPATFTAVHTGGCIPYCVQFSGSSAGASSWWWDFGDGGNATTNAPAYCYTTAGTYTFSLTVTDSVGCSTTITDLTGITVAPPPVASFTATPLITDLSAPEICFSNTSTGGNAYLWDFGTDTDTLFSAGTTCHTFTDTGTYCVSLLTQGDGMCADTTSLCVLILPDFTLYIPNAFTPNGDALNDLFLPLGTGLQTNSYELLLFDRWGNLIWKTNQWGTGWDGKANGGQDIAQIDVYVWKIQVSDLRGNLHRRTGHVSLIR